jgi:TolB-like protein/Flp pilus assembly protein TadD
MIHAELKRRKVFRVAGIYVVAAWVFLQVADLAFESWGIASEALRYVWIGVIAGFPIALFLGWRFDFAGGRIVRTPDDDSEVPQALERSDHVILSLAAIAAIVITAGMLVGVLQTRTVPPETNDVASADPKSIAVLPFTDMSATGDQAYFSDGIAEELLNLLSKYNGLRVISRSSSFALRDAGLSIPEVADRLNVAHVLEGSVRKAGNRVRVTAQLIEARSDTHLWSETYDRELNDVFAIQDEISAQVVRELKVRLLGAAPSAGATSNAAYDLYLQGLSLFADRSGTGFSPMGGGGLHLLARRRDDTVRQAITLFEQAVAIDPEYAPGHASLALAFVLNGCGHRRCESDQDKSVRHTRAEAAAGRALELDRQNSDALATLGWIRYEQAQIAQARDYLERAIDSNPNNPLGYRWLGISYQNEDPVRNLALIQKAFLVDPLDSTIHFDLATSQYRLGRRDEAMDVARDRLALDPTDSSPYGLAGRMFWFSGELDLAVKSLYRAYRADPGRRTYLEIIGVLGALDELELAYLWFQELQRRTEVQDYGMEAVLAMQRGRDEEAIRIVARDYTHWYASWFMRFTRDYDRARQLYEQGFAEMGLDISQFNPALLWRFYVEYAGILQHTGEPERAKELNRDIMAAAEKQIADGVVVGGIGDYLLFATALIYASSGDTEQAVEALEQAVSYGFLCTECLIGIPRFESMRDRPEFQALIARMQARKASQHRRLADEGMLLTPDEVMALEDFSFDPFAD